MGDSFNINTNYLEIFCFAYFEVHKTLFLKNSYTFIIFKFSLF